MEEKILFTVIELVILVLAWLVGKYKLSGPVSDVLNKAYNELDFITTYAERYVSWARQFLSAKKGSEKMEYVVEALQNLAKQNNIEMSDEQIQAIVQYAYDCIIKPEKDAEAIVASSKIINEGTEKIAILDDDIKVIKE